MIRLPINQPARMTISISDETGTILALYRMADGTVFSSDVAMTKARNAYYFSTREGYDVLRYDRAQRSEHDTLHVDAGTARRQGLGGHRAHDQLRRASRSSRRVSISTSSSRSRTASRSTVRGSISTSTTARTRARKGPGATRGGNRSFLNQSGIVWFPGSVPLYRGDRVIGGLGVSGDGVEQDDYVSQLGSEGFHPPDALRVDNSVMTDAKGRAGAAALPEAAEEPGDPEVGRVFRPADESVSRSRARFRIWWRRSS